MARRLSPAAVNLLVAVCALLLVLTLAEGVARLLEPEPLKESQAAPELIRDWKDWEDEFYRFGQSPPRWPPDGPINRDGLRDVVYKVYFRNGKLDVRKVVKASWVRKPVAAIVTVGTQAPAPTTNFASGSTVWDALAQCESGNNPRAVSSGGTYRGLYQFSLSTWRGVGGSGDPIDASRSEQTYRAKLLFKRRGASPWPHCGSRLYS